MDVVLQRKCWNKRTASIVWYAVGLRWLSYGPANYEVRHAGEADRRIIIRPSSVVVSLGWTMLNDAAKSTSRKSVARQIDTPAVLVRPSPHFSSSFSSVFTVGRSSPPAGPTAAPARLRRAPGVSISIRPMPITRRPSRATTAATSTIKRFIIAAGRSPTSNRIQIVVLLTVAIDRASRPSGSPNCPAALTNSRELNAVSTCFGRCHTSGGFLWFMVATQIVQMAAAWCWQEKSQLSFGLGNKKKIIATRL